MKTYNKLVRDKIIEIIESKGGKAVFHIADEPEFLEKCIEKLSEEVAEFTENPCQEELADILEVIDALVIVKNWDMSDVLAVQKKKREERGGFEQRLILEES